MDPMAFMVDPSYFTSMELSCVEIEIAESQDSEEMNFDNIKIEKTEYEEVKVKLESWKEEPDFDEVILTPESDHLYVLKDDQEQNEMEEKPYVCVCCNKMFETKQRLKQHIYQTHVEMQYTCLLCQKQFRTSQALASHITLHTGGKAYVCEWCGATFSLSNNRAKHIRRVHIQLQPSPPRTESGKGHHMCELCSKSFTIASNLTKHIKHIHGGEKPFACSHCDKRFRDTYDMIRHMKVHKGDSKRKHHSCDQCGREFSQIGNLIKHKKYIHSQEKPFACTVCEKAFKSTYDLRRHVSIHSDVKSFTTSRPKPKPSPCICPVCGASFTMMSNLRKHEKLMHILDKQFICDVCSKQFRTKFDLNRHRKIHTVGRPFGCELCGKSFAREGHLRRHKVRSHDLKKQHICQHCEKRFRSSGHLKRHVKIHFRRNDVGHFENSKPEQILDDDSEYDTD